MDLFKDKIGTTKASHEQRFKRIQDILEVKGNDFVKDGNKILKELKEKPRLSPITKKPKKPFSDNTLKTYITTLLIASVSLGMKDAEKVYRNEMNNLGDKIQKQRELNLPKCGTKLPDSKELKDVLDKIPEHEQDFLIAAMYLLTPPLRADYANLKIFKRDPKLTDSNYLVNNNSTTMLVLNKYKNFKKFGQIKIRYTGRLKQIIKSQIRSRPKNEFLLQVGKKAMDPTYLSGRVSRIFNRYLKEKVSINDIRCIWETELQNSAKYANMNKTQRRKEHAKVLHTLEEASLYRKVDPTKE